MPKKQDFKAIKEQFLSAFITSVLSGSSEEAVEHRSQDTQTELVGGFPQKPRVRRWICVSTGNSSRRPDLVPPADSIQQEHLEVLVVSTGA